MSSDCKVGVALGSNLGERLAHLRNARKDIGALPGALPPLRSSALYETEPVGCEKGAGKFLNAVIEFGYAGEPLDLLHRLAAIESSWGRPGAHPKNVSRTLDLDLLYFGDLEIDSGELQLPHPRITDREFVLRPLADIRPDLVLPKQTESVGVLLRRFMDATAVVRLGLEW